MTSLDDTPAAAPHRPAEQTQEPRDESKGTPPARLFFPEDEKTLGLLLAVGLLCLFAVWCFLGGPWGKLVSPEQAVPLTAEYQMDVNQADWAELAQLPGIGEAVARRIVEYRRQGGPFQSLDDLDHVNGIGPKTLQRIRPYLRPIPAPARVK